MRDEKVAVLSLPIETNSAANHCCGPVEHFYASWNCNEHRGNGEKHIKWTAHPHREHVMSPNAQTQDRDGNTRGRDKFVTENRFPRKNRNDFGDDGEGGKGHDVDFRMAKCPKNVLPQNGRT